MAREIAFARPSSWPEHTHTHTLSPLYGFSGLFWFVLFLFLSQRWGWGWGVLLAGKMHCCIHAGMSFGISPL